MPLPKSEQEYAALREKFEKFIDDRKELMDKKAAEAGEKGFTYGNGSLLGGINELLEAKGPNRENDIQIETNTPANYLEGLTSAVHEMLNRPDFQTLEEKNANLEWCMNLYQHQLQLLGKKLNTRETEAHQEQAYGRAILGDPNPMYGTLKQTIQKLGEDNDFLKVHTEGELESLSDHEAECERAFYHKVAQDPEFGEKMVAKAQDELRIPGMITAGRLQQDVDIIVLGKRAEAERKNAEIYYNKKLPENVREMYKPHPAFDPQSFSDDTDEYVNNLLTSARKKFDVDKMMRTYFHVETVVADQLNSQLGVEALRPGSEDYGKNIGRIYRVGHVHNLKIDAKDLKAISGTGSPEFTELHNAYRDYITQQRDPGSFNFNMKKAENSVYEASMDYLFKKKSKPITPDGKDRVEAAAKLFTEASLNKLGGMKDKTPERTEIINRLKLEMLRNPTCRKLVESMNASHKKIDPDVSLDLMAFAGEVNDLVGKKGIALEGKLEDPNKALAAIATGYKVPDLVNAIQNKEMSKVVFNRNLV